MTYAKPFYTGIAENNYELKSKLMKLFILYQTDNWKSKASRVCFGARHQSQSHRQCKMARSTTTTIPKWWFSK